MWVKPETPTVRLMHSALPFPLSTLETKISSGACQFFQLLLVVARKVFHARSSSSRTVRVIIFWHPLHLNVVSTGASSGTRGSTLISRSGAAQCGHVGAIEVGDFSAPSFCAKPEFSLRPSISRA
jgi:hypothetical protein